jgi:hypothetical protein
MTRIGRWQIKTRQLAGNASYRRDKLAPLKIFKSNSRLTLTPPGPQAFFLNRIAGLIVHSNHGVMLHSLKSTLPVIGLSTILFKRIEEITAILTA